MAWTAILVAEEAQARADVRTMLLRSEPPFRVVGEASGGRKALELIGLCRPDLVITDIMLPEMDGVELLRRAREAGCDSRFVMLTCMNEFEYARQALELGASSYMLKPSMDQPSFKQMLEKVDAELKRLSRFKRLESYLSALPEETRTATDHPEINKVIDYLNESYRENVTLAKAAAYVKLDPSYLSDLFKRKTSCTLTQYVMRLRVDAARFYLTQTGDSVSDIGERVGFMNDNYFIKIFKRFTGVTPSVYRKQHRVSRPE